MNFLGNHSNSQFSGIKFWIGILFIVVYLVDMAFSKVFGVPPEFFLLMLVFVFYANDMLNIREMYNKTVRNLLIVLFFIYGVMAIVSDIQQSRIDQTQLLFYHFCVVVIIGSQNTRNRTNGNYLIFAIYCSVLVASCIWFLLTVYFHELLLIQDILYGWPKSNTIAIVEPMGFVPWAHLFGYQVAPIWLIMFALLSHSARIYRIFIVLILITCTVVIYFYGERAVVVAVGASLLLYILYSGAVKKTMAAIVLLGVVVLLMGSFGIFGSSRFFDLDRSNVLIRLSDATAKIEGAGRVSLQFTGISVILSHPFGLFLEHESWEYAARQVDKGAFDYWNDDIAVHNGYLGQVIMYGYLFAVAILYILYRLISISLKLLHSSIYSTHYGKALGIGMIGCIIQGLFHNASIITGERSTVVLMMIMFAAFSTFSDRKEGLNKG